MLSLSLMFSRKHLYVAATSPDVCDGTPHARTFHLEAGKPPTDGRDEKANDTQRGES
jgi:hypothetical protein